MKPGIKTSELWITVAAQIVALLQVYGVLGDVEASAWLQLVTALIAVVPMVAYIWSRTELKKYDFRN